AVSAHSANDIVKPLYMLVCFILRLSTCLCSQAVSAHSANDIVNYERLETLGDSLLKLATTLCVYTSLGTLDEGELTLIKGTVVGNRNLYLAGRRLALPGYIK
ncbi:uncharacterized protein LOC113473444, partial [Diaphorina citri]|uniref:Uncharacterized protein LOC113473444 n=1 Tax=Diaphorina citri TaxID=121845 RepID=A0A3Q0JKI5_DIACI